jgi:aminoglycoside phosphotransferase family enzyme
MRREPMPSATAPARRPADAPAVPLAAKLAFLGRPESYPGRPAAVERRETHLSWVFLAGDEVYKMKKPVRAAGLDLRTLARRRRNCRAELRLNPRLAPEVYRGLVALTLEPGGRLALGGRGRPVEWLVRMRRLPAGRTLDRALAAGRAGPAEIDAVAAMLTRFYRRAPPAARSPTRCRRHLREEIEASRAALTALPARPPGRLALVAARLTAWLRQRPDPLAGRPLVEGHGDLRPEHVYLGPPPQAIDCLEFRRSLRLLDPADELAYLALECERLGAPWVGPRLLAAYEEATGDRPPAALIAFYKSVRALIRARLAILHLEDAPRARHVKWRRQAANYLAWADRLSAGLCPRSADRPPARARL